jgi:hypothetical protein
LQNLKTQARVFHPLPENLLPALHWLHRLFENEDAEFAELMKQKAIEAWEFCPF